MTGGAIYTFNSGSVSLEANYLSGNEASTSGGAIYAQDTYALEVYDNTLSNNEAYYGGGIYSFNANNANYHFNSAEKNYAIYGIVVIAIKFAFCEHHCFLRLIAFIH